jgi:hypothetical protein
MIRLLPSSIRNTLLNKKPLQLPFILRMLHSLQNSCMSNSTYRIRLPRQRNFVFILNSSTFFNSLLEEGEILLVEFEEGDVCRDLVGDGPYCRGCAFMCEEGSYFVGGADVVYVVFREGFVFGEGKSGPDYAFGLDGGDEKCGFLGEDVVCEVGIWELAAREVIEESSLSAERERLLVRGTGEWVEGCTGRVVSRRCLLSSWSFGFRDRGLHH